MASQELVAQEPGLVFQSLKREQTQLTKKQQTGIQTNENPEQNHANGQSRYFTVTEKDMEFPGNK